MLNVGINQVSFFLSHAKKTRPHTHKMADIQFYKTILLTGQALQQLLLKKLTRYRNKLTEIGL